MISKVKPSDLLSKTIDNLLSCEQPTKDLLTELLQSGTQRILQQTSEAEVDELLVHGWYVRSDENQDSPHRG